jgi:hypothetical protein
MDGELTLGRALGRCPCGGRTTEPYYWHRLTDHDCMHHAERMKGCPECMARGLAAKFAADVERWLSGQVA